MNLRHRSYQKELLDRENIPFKDIAKNMEELNTINTYLGGHAITQKGFTALLGKKQSITICEIGCGGGDNLAAIARWCDRNSIRVNFIGIDIKQECIIVAAENPFLQERASWITSDYQLVSLNRKPDIIFSSLFCHHFSETELEQQLQWMKANSQLGFFINDLHRNLLAYHAIRLLTVLFSSSYLVKNDAPLSVARGFLRREWYEIFRRANINPTQIQWKWAFRHLIICKNE